MTRPDVLIFDLSEVLIRGLYGVEDDLHLCLSLPKEEILSAFRGPRLFSLFLGEISEEEFLAGMIETEGWTIAVESVMRLIRKNMRQVIPGTRALHERYRLVLLSDHAREWANFVREEHDFWPLFEAVYFSFELGATKMQSDTFSQVSEMLSVSPSHCLFVDDRNENVTNAQRAGMSAVQFTSAQDLTGQLEEFGISTAN